MANEVEWTYASQVTLEDNGASGASDVMIAADDADLASANHSNYPLADFVLKASFGGDLGGGKAVYLFRQDLNIDGANDAEPPAASTFEEKLVGIFALPSGFSSTATGYFSCTDVPLAKDQQFSIKNASGQGIDAGWDLKATPKTYAPGS